ncbi:MAG: glycine/sarcosine/betaine reductase selenoprotein B family protein [Litorilinea sp.]
MGENHTLRERISNWLFAIPAVAEWWSQRTAKTTGQLVDVSDPTPFAPVTKPLAQMRMALVTTGGFHRTDQTPFDMENPLGDPTYRVIPDATPRAELTITHKYYDHTDADTDHNVVFPLELLHELVDKQVIGATAPRHFAFMGHIDGELIATLNQETAPAVAEMLKQDQIDAVLLTPA